LIAYVARRIALLFLISFGVLLMTFFVSHVIPGDPARLAAGPGADRQQVDAIRETLGLDLPVHEQFVRYVDNLLHGDLGTSIVTRQPVTQELRRRIPATFELVGVSFVVYLVVGIALAVLAATTRLRIVDVVVRLASTSAYAIPSFVLALWLQLVVFFHLGWLPASGRLSVLTTPPDDVTGFLLIDSLLDGRPGVFVEALKYLALPVIALTFGLIAIAVRIIRATLLTELTRDYVKMARLKGLSEGAIVRRHVLRNSLVPALALFGIQFGYLVGGTVVIESIFAWPGIGAYAFDSIVALDYAPVIGVTLVTTACFVLVNFVIDLLYPVIDPRIRLWGATS
jgi:peptide/nickel transport system permease protein